MNDPEKPPDNSWDKVDSIIRRQEQGVTSTALPQDKPLARIAQATEKLRQDRLGLLGRFQAGGIERRAALEMIRSMHEAQLDVTKHALKRAVDVEKERVDLIARKYIFEITEEVLRDMEVMGIHNFKARMETLLKLNAEAARLFLEAEGQDVPERIKDMTRDAIFKKFKEFFDRLTADEIKLG